MLALRAVSVKLVGGCTGAADVRQRLPEKSTMPWVIHSDGNVDLNILSRGTPADVEEEVRRLVLDVGPGGGYIVASGNSLASYVRSENALAIGEATRKYGCYPLRA